MTIGQTIKLYRSEKNFTQGQLPVTGTLGVLMKAKQQRYLSELKTVLDVMVQNGIYIKPSLVELCLKQVGEL